MTSSNLATHRFTANDQETFAALSGDYNPMHMDPVAARRTAAGAPVVHGMHVLLWSLDNLARAYPDLPPVRTLKVRFDKLIYVGDTVQVTMAQRDASGLRLEVTVDSTPVCRFAAGFAAPRTKLPVVNAASPVYRPRARSEALALAMEEMSGRSGRIEFAVPPATIAGSFPDAARAWGSRRISALACCTYLVGMTCPGLHSIFGGLTVNVCDDDELQDGIAFQVTGTEPRFRSVRITVGGSGVSATIESFARHPPVAQQDMAALKEMVTPGEFAGATALVVGGSRGLGELTAKLLAAGGGRVVVTYLAGRDDAARLQQEITAAGGTCETLRYDVCSQAQPQLGALPHPPCLMFYFATPSIFRRKAGLFVADRLSEFMQFYVNGFYDLCEALRPHRPAGVSVFYPSSVAVETRPADMTEYAMSKMAGEVLCADMLEFQQPIAITMNRLPRLPTDQTATLMEVASADPCAVMLPIIREVYGRRIP